MARVTVVSPEQRIGTDDGRLAMDLDLRWVNQVMAFLAAANFVVSAMRTVLLFMN